MSNRVRVGRRPATVDGQAWSGRRRSRGGARTPTGRPSYVVTRTAVTRRSWRAAQVRPRVAELVPGRNADRLHPLCPRCGFDRRRRSGGRPGGRRGPGACRLDRRRPELSRDSSRLVYGREPEARADDPSLGTEILVFDLATRQETVVASEGLADEAVWSPDGAETCSWPAPGAVGAPGRREPRRRRRRSGLDSSPTSAGTRSGSGSGLERRCTWPRSSNRTSSGSPVDRLRRRRGGRAHRGGPSGVRRRPRLAPGGTSLSCPPSRS